MNAIAEQYAQFDIVSIFLYTHEAHPGEHYPHLTSMEQKFEHARALRDVLKLTRPILIDALEGSLHRAYGSMPNMSWIFNRAAVPIYKSDWTDAYSLQNSLDYTLQVIERRQSGGRVAPFRVERLDYRQSDPEGFRKGLERNGPKAVREYERAFG